DLTHVASALEAVAQEQVCGLADAVRYALVALAVLRYAQHEARRTYWIAQLEKERAALEQRLAANPSLRRSLVQVLAAEWSWAVKLAEPMTGRLPGGSP